MELGVIIAIKVLQAAYVGLGSWLTMRVLARTGFPWWWAPILWLPGLIGLIPRLEFLGILALPLPLILTWLFAYTEWPAMLNTASIGWRADQGAPEPALSDRGEDPQSEKRSSETQLLGTGTAPNPDSLYMAQGWLLSGFDDKGRTVRLEVNDKELAAQDEGVVIGRHPDLAQIVLSDDSVSRQHARLSLKGKRLVVEDLDSANGTIVNGERLIPKRGFALKRGATIEFGAVKLTVSRA